MKTTTNEAVPYAADTDSSALGPELQALLLSQDSRFSTWDAAFGMIGKGPGFSARCTVDGSNIATNNLQTVQFQTIDYDKGLNSGTSGIGQFQWNQQSGDGPSWWIFGAQVHWASTQTPSSPNIVQIRINVTDVDPNSTTGTTLQFYDQGNQDALDTNADQQLQAITLAHFRNDHAGIASVYFMYRDTAGSQLKHYRAGSRFWGFRVGNG